jgi:cytoskeletal protein RodZ
MEGEPEPDATLFPATVGEKLRAAREAQGLGLAEIAAATRIPQRHLEAIEKSQYASLPSITYALGFAKAYARAVGIDEVAHRDRRRLRSARHGADIL